MPAALRLPDAGGLALDPRLLAEIGGELWETSWALTPTIHTPAVEPGARRRMWSLEAMLRPHARDSFALSPNPNALDLQCGEGWLAQRLLDLGARHVLATDSRPERLRRARLLRDHFGVTSAELELVGADELPEPAAEARFDVVLITGMPERAADTELLARAHSSSRSIVAIECLGDDASTVAETALEAGFREVGRLRPPLHGAPEFIAGHRDLLLARVRAGHR